MVLRQDKLDVIAKTRANLFNWRGQFTPEFVEYILSSFTQPGHHVLDPFSGSGTVLQESARLGLSATGLEINPSAYAMSRFFAFCNMSIEERMNFCSSFELTTRRLLSNLNGQKIFSEDKDYRKSYLNLIDFARDFYSNLEEKMEKVFLMNMLFQSEKDKTLTVKDSILKSFFYIKNCLINLPYTDFEINAQLKDARTAGIDFENKIDLILTSPPYINVFNYHQNFRAIVETFNFDLLKVAHSEFGSNRKNRANRFKTVIQFCLDMELAIHSFWNALRDSGKIVLILGRQSNVRGTPFYNGQIVTEILERSCGFANINVYERKFVNKFGALIKEDIISADKTSRATSFGNGSEIALRHLRDSLSNVSNDINSDIEEAISSISEVKASPFFDPSNVISYVQ